VAETFELPADYSSEKVIETLKQSEDPLPLLAARIKVAERIVAHETETPRFQNTKYNYLTILGDVASGLIGDEPDIRSAANLVEDELTSIAALSYDGSPVLIPSMNCVKDWVGMYKNTSEYYTKQRINDADGYSQLAGQVLDVMVDFIEPL
jgi:hypothetical protein